MMNAERKFSLPERGDLRVAGALLHRGNSMCELDLVSSSKDTDRKFVLETGAAC